MPDFIPTDILVTASESLEESIEEDLANATFPADPLAAIAANTVAYVGPQTVAKPAPEQKK